MEKNRSFSIIIPAYNESSSIVSTISDIKKLSGKFEIIVVDDNSTDETFELACKTGVKVLRHHTNSGYGASLKTGIRNAKYKTIVITDADETYPNKDIPALVKTFEQEDYDMVVGARIKVNVKIPLTRKPAKWCLTKLANYLSETEIPDLNSGLRVMRKSVLEEYFHILPDGFSFTTTITLAMLTNKHDVKYVPIDYYERKGKSKIKPISDTIKFLKLIIMTILYFNPLKVFVPLSFMMFLLSLFIFLYSYFFLSKIMDVTVMIFFTTGIQIMAIGMIADLIDKRMR